MSAASCRTMYSLSLSSSTASLSSISFPLRSSSSYDSTSSKDPVKKRSEHCWTALYCGLLIPYTFSGAIWLSRRQWRFHWVATKNRVPHHKTSDEFNQIWKPLMRVLQCHHLLESRCFFAKRCDHFVNVDIKSTRPYKTRVSNCMHSLWLYGTSLLCSKKGWMSKLSSNFFWNSPSLGRVHTRQLQSKFPSFQVSNVHITK